ncbi:MAG TPA: hypothetical protein DCE56_32880 [Cyanobacteria bacterium UBA8553]|nr:hypothetical protein [Cyanobacteria bacterium UBA8553]HAJ61297.1 hypothetical protein [Cyanobacteria bacterium UBA8543]
MIRFNAVVIASVLMLGSITSCNNADEDAAVVSTPQAVRPKTKKPKAATPNPTASASTGKAKTTKAAKPSPSPGQTKASPAKAAASAKGDSKQTLAKLNGYLPAAVNALKANDVDTAKKYAKSFNDNWKQKIVQFNVKNKSQDNYKKISAAVEQVNTNLIKPAKPDNAKAIAALQSLSQAVKSYTASP